MEQLSTNNLLNLTGKVALVTGAGRGIGRAIALRLADAGASVVVCDINDDNARETTATIESRGGKSLSVVADLGNTAEIPSIVEAVVSAYGHLDILVNNAALRGWSTWDTLTEDDWDRFMAINTRAVFFMSQAAAKQMIAQGHGGSIINIASTAAVHPVRWKVDYNTAKAGVAQMSKSLALELGKHMIRVNAIGPGGTDTQGGYGSVESSFSPEDLRKMGEDWFNRMALPVGILDPDDIARGVLFFCGDISRSVTGQVLFVDGGYLVG